MSTTLARQSRRDHKGLPPSYVALCQEWPLRPIRNLADYDAASHVLDRLVVRPEEDLDSGERDYLEMLELAIERYDDEHCQIKETGTPLEHLKEMMRQANMRTTDLGKLIGNRGLASLILNGKRELSKAHIRILAERFKVSPALFI